MKHIVDVVPSKQCTGCGACYNKCPMNIIEMQQDSEGFLKPVVASEKCTDCGLCATICPAIKPDYNKNADPSCYAVMAHDDVRMRSSSGGVFELLANSILEKGGSVCGVAWKEGFHGVEHILIDKKEDLHKLQGSKYIQSNTNTVYKEIKSLLENEKFVLFSGTPCQVAGIESYLGDLKNSNYFLSVDLLCHGVPSEKVWKKYLEEIHFRQSIKKVSFKGKEVLGWNGGNVDITFNNGSHYNKGALEDLYFKAFLRNIILNKPCCGCIYARLPRQGDISIGDYWGINDYDRALNDRKGTSVVLINTDKGHHVFHNDLKNRCKLVKQTPLSAATKRNTIIKSSKLGVSRSQFFKNMNNKSFAELTRWAMLKTRYDIGVIGIPTHPNWGGALTYYSLYCVLTDMGYSVTMIAPPEDARVQPFPQTQTFEKDAYDSKILRLNFKNKEQMTHLNLECDCFLVGSDQMFGSNLIRHVNYMVLLDWVKDNHKKVAYAASFGHEKFRGDEQQRAYMAHYIQKFDAFSVRENTGLQVAKNTFGKSAEWVLDPVFLCDKKHLIELADKTEHKTDFPHIFSYILDPDDEKNNILSHVKEKLQLPVELYSEMYFTPEKHGSLFCEPLSLGKVEQRLYSMIHSDFIVTDSYHGMCMAIIFEKPFIAILNPRRGQDRFLSVVQKIELHDRLVTSIEEIKERGLLDKVFDNTRAKELLNVECERSRAWLKQAIEKDYDIKKSFSTVDILHDEIRKLRDELLKLNKMTEFKILNVCGGEIMITITNVIEYFTKLSKTKGNFIVVVSVKDTPGIALTEEVANVLIRAGMNKNLSQKHWQSYLGIINEGTIVEEKLSSNQESVEFNGVIEENNFHVISKSLNNGNLSSIKINGEEYSQNLRGLNIVLFDKNMNSVIDSVNFDTHIPDFTCNR